MSKLSKSDVDKYGLLGDPNFSEAHNQAVIKSTIKKTEENYKKRQKMVEEGLAERTDLIYSYIRHALNKHSDMDITEYAGWENLKRLWGETRIRDLQERAQLFRQTQLKKG